MKLKQFFLAFLLAFVCVHSFSQTKKDVVVGNADEVLKEMRSFSPEGPFKKSDYQGVVKTIVVTGEINEDQLKEIARYFSEILSTNGYYYDEADEYHYIEPKDRGIISANLDLSKTNGLNKIPERAFREALSLKTIILPNEITEIENSAFDSCVFLESIIIPNSVTQIGKYAFSGCKSLKTIYYAVTKEQWRKIQIAENNETLLQADIEFINL